MAESLEQTAGIVWLTLRVVTLSLALAVSLGLPLGVWLVYSRANLRRIVNVLVHTLMGTPPVLAGLLVYLAVSRTGPLGALEVLFTPAAMVLAQTLIAAPIIAGLVAQALRGLDPDLRIQLFGLGASPRQSLLAALREARDGIVVAVLAAFGRLVGEVGAVMLVGGNIEGHTRTLTTAIVVETRMGRFDVALGLGAVLMLVALLGNIAALRLNRSAPAWELSR